MSRLFIAMATVACCATALPAAAQFQRPEQAVKYRQSAMSLQSSHMGRIVAMTSGRVPFDAKVAAENIEIVAVLNKLQFSAFVDGTDKVGNTRAKPEIWTDKDKWAAAVAKSQDDVGKLLLAGRSGNLDPIKTAVGAVAQSCDACHDAFRSK
jgi:cytochrome c556